MDLADITKERPLVDEEQTPFDHEGIDQTKASQNPNGPDDAALGEDEDELDVSGFFESLEQGLEGALLERIAREEAAKLTPKAMVDRLKVLGEAAITDNPFNTGDLVTPRPDVRLKGAGDPHIVIQVEEFHDDFESFEPGHPDYGRRNDVRVISIVAGHAMAHWVEHWQLEPYTLPADETSPDAVDVDSPPTAA